MTRNTQLAHDKNAVSFPASNRPASVRLRNGFMGSSFVVRLVIERASFRQIAGLAFGHEPLQHVVRDELLHLPYQPRTNKERFNRCVSPQSS
jgi:hypothetical protein